MNIFQETWLVKRVIFDISSATASSINLADIAVMIKSF